MKFVSVVRNQYRVVAGLSNRESVALTLLSEAVASEIDNMLHEPETEDSHAHEHLKTLRGMVYGRELTESVEWATEDLDLNLKDYLPVDLVAKIAHEWETKTKVKFDKVPEQEQHRIALNALGHGVSPFDDKEFSEWLKENGHDPEEVKKGWHKHSYFESSYDMAWDWIKDAVEAIKKED